MPKVKTRKAVAKRIKVTGSGKLLRGAPGGGHLKSTKSPKQIRRLRKKSAVPAGFVRMTKRMLGI